MNNNIFPQEIGFLIATHLIISDQMVGRFISPGYQWCIATYETSPTSSVLLAFGFLPRAKPPRRTPSAATHGNVIESPASRKEFDVQETANGSVYGFDEFVIFFVFFLPLCERLSNSNYSRLL